MPNDPESVRPEPLPRPAPKAAEPAPVDEFSDVALLERFVKSCRSNRHAKTKVHRLWEAIQINIALPTDKAKELCKRFNVDPESVVYRE